VTFNIYPGPDKSTELYEDDGLTNNYQTGAFRITEVSHQGILNGQRARVQHTQGNYKPPETYYFISFLGTNPPVTVTAAGAPLPNVLTPDALAGAGANSYYYNASIKTTFLKIIDVPDIMLEVTF